MRELKSIEILVLNELLKNRENYLVNTIKGHIGISDIDRDGVQGEYNEVFKYYKHPKLPENIFLKETINTDSYGDNDTSIVLEFVQGKEKQITVFEPI